MSLSERKSAIPAFVEASTQDVNVGLRRKSSHRSRLSVRVDEAERAYLERLAGPETLSAFVRRTLLGNAVIDKKVRPKKKPRKPNVDQSIAAQLLAALGQSRLASNLNQISKLANMGALPVTPELETEIHEACRDISWMRQALIKALGIKDQ